MANKEKVIESIKKATEYKSIIIGCIILFIIIYLSYIYSQSYRVSKTLHDMRNINAYLKISSKLNTAEYRELKLRDFNIAAAFRPYMATNQLLDYCNLRITEKIIRSGARCLYIDIFNSTVDNHAEPIISVGSEIGQWKLTLNTILFDDFCKLLGYTCFSSGYVNNFEDPFILMLNLNTNGNINCLNKVKDIIYTRLKRYLLSNKYTYSSVNIFNEPVKNFMGKLIILSSSGYKNSDLEEFVNYNWEKDDLRKISYEALYPDIEDASIIRINSTELKEYNKNNVTIVTPSEHTFFTYNYKPSYFWESGCQIVCLNYQKIDENLDEYITNFRTESFIPKPMSMRGTDASDKPKLKQNPVVLESKNKPEYVTERCPEIPAEDYAASSAMIKFKDNNANMGLCFINNESPWGDCNCKKKTKKDIRDCIKECDKGDPKLKDECNKDCNYNCVDTLYNKNGLIGRTEDLCCANRPIFDPSNVQLAWTNTKYYKYYLSKTDKTDKTDKNQKGQPYICNKILNSGVILKDGAQNFESATDDNKVNLYKCPIEEYDDLKGNICLLDKNNNPLKKCPDGWDYNGQLDYDTYQQNINICCRDV